MQGNNRAEDLDRMFDILLVLLGIVTATLFQFVCAVAPIQIAAQNPSLPQDQLAALITEEITRWLRVFFIPLIILIAIWFFNRIALVQRFGVKRALSEFCYVMGFTILAHDIMYFAGAVTMRPLTEITASNVGGGPYSVFITFMVFLVSLGLIYAYEVSPLPGTGARVDVKGRRFWRNVLLRSILFWFLALGIINWIEMLSVWAFI